MKRRKYKRRRWAWVDLAKLKRLYPDTPTAKLAALLKRPICSVYGMAFSLGLKKSDAYRASPAACRLRRGDNVGAAYRFKPGHVPANKGLRRPGWYAGNMRATQFKKGTLNGRAEQLYQPIGTERTNDDGYLVRKVTEKGRGAQRWKAVHVLMWEECYGPVPPGYMVCFIDNNRRNIRLDNLMLLSQHERMRLNTIARFPPELRHAIRLTRKLQRTIKERTSEKRDYRPA